MDTVFFSTPESVAKITSVSLSTELVVVICVHSSHRSNLRVLLVPQTFAHISCISSSPPKRYRLHAFPNSWCCSFDAVNNFETQRCMLAVCVQVHIEWNNGNVCNANEGIPRNMTAIATQLGRVGYVSHQLGKW